MLCAGAWAGHAQAQTVDDQALVAAGSSIDIDVLANDVELGPRARIVNARSTPNGRVVRLPSGIVRYTPNPGFRGEDSFQYTALGNRTGGTSTVTVRVGDPLRIEGRVTDSPIADAQVTFRIGEDEFQAQADGEGFYSAEVVGWDSTQMVTAQALGGPGQALVNFSSVLGSFGLLADQAGEDGVLAREENNQAQITNLSTAQAYLVAQANGGQLPATDGELEVAFQAVNTDELMTMAAAIKLVVDGQLALPEGINDTQALIASGPLLAGFLADAEADNPGVINNTIASIVSDPEVVPPVTADQVPESIALVLPARAGSILRGRGGGGLFEFDADGTGNFLASVGVSDPGTTWELLPDGSIEVVFVEPRTVLSFPIRDGVQVRSFISSTGRTLRLLGSNGGVDLVSVFQSSVTTFPDNPEYPDEVTEGYSTLLGYRAGAGELPYVEADIIGTRALGFPDNPFYVTDPQDFAYALHRFDAGGTGAIPSIGKSFTWSLDGAGRLDLVYQDDSRTTVRRVAVDGRKGEGVLLDSTLGDGRRVSVYDLSMVEDAGILDSVDWAGYWRNAFDISNPAVPLESPQGFFAWWRDEPAGSGFTFSIGADGQIFGTPVPHTWSVQGGELVGNGFFCQACTAGSERRWRPVAEDGDRVYMIEELYFDREFNGVLRFTAQRGAYYDRRVPPQSPTVVSEPKPKTIAAPRLTRTALPRGP